MKDHQKTKLATLLGGMTPNERAKIYKEATQMRDHAMRRERSAMRVYSEDDEGDEPRQRKAASIEQFVLKLLLSERPATVTAPDGLSATVLLATGDRCTLRASEETFEGVIVPEVLREFPTGLAPGDEAIVDGTRVVAIRPRKTVLSRPDPDNANKELVLAANVEVVVIVASFVTPPFRPRLIDRALVSVQRGGAQPALCVNKLDLLSDEEREGALAEVETYRTLGIGVTVCSTVQNTGIEGLQEILQGKLVAFLGHSGVGKSSLLNALSPGLGLKVGGTSVGYGRGKHTTTVASLHDIGNGTRVIDTPGVRALGLVKMTLDDLPWHFPDFLKFAEECRFRDCTHTHEPVCGVRDAVETGRLDSRRYEAYRRIRESL